MGHILQARWTTSTLSHGNFPSSNGFKINYFRIQRCFQRRTVLLGLSRIKLLIFKRWTEFINDEITKLCNTIQKVPFQNKNIISTPIILTEPRSGRNNMFKPCKIKQQFLHWPRNCVHGKKSAKDQVTEYNPWQWRTVCATIYCTYRKRTWDLICQLLGLYL